MNELDTMLEAPAEMALSPLVRYCKTRQEAGDKIEFELLRSDAWGGSSPTALLIHRWQAGTQHDSSPVLWDDRVNSGLVDLGIRSIDLDQEAKRFAIMIRVALRKVEELYGDGYLNIVLLDLVDRSDLCKSDEIAEVRKFIHTNSPKPGVRSDEVRELIASEIGGRAAELKHKLKYNPDEIKAVMTKALAIYLDERFSVSSRRFFGML